MQVSRLWWRCVLVVKARVQREYLDGGEILGPRVEVAYLCFAGTVKALAVIISVGVNRVGYLQGRAGNETTGGSGESLN
jgi:hypothetical protein